jgi:glutathione S-transferase
MLEEIAEPYEVEWIAYGEQMKGAKYLSINPMGKVPAIVHLGNVVTSAQLFVLIWPRVFQTKILFQQ